MAVKVISTILPSLREGIEGWVRCALGQCTPLPNPSPYGEGLYGHGIWAAAAEVILVD